MGTIDLSPRDGIALAASGGFAPFERVARDAGLRVATLTNGSAALTEALLERAGLSDLVERCLDVAETRRWKPAPEPYLHACRTLGVAPGDAVLIAAHPWDVHGAKLAALRGAWLGRDRRRSARAGRRAVASQRLRKCMLALLYGPRRLPSPRRASPPRGAGARRGP